MEFLYSNPYSSIEVTEATIPPMDFAWEASHFEQGFCIRPGAVAVSTYTDDDYQVCVVEAQHPPQDLGGAVFAVQLPFRSSALKLKVQGLYYEAEIEMTRQVWDITFIEYPESRLAIFLNTNEALTSSRAILLKPSPKFPRVNNFVLTSKPFELPAEPVELGRNLGATEFE